MRYSKSTNGNDYVSSQSCPLDTFGKWNDYVPSQNCPFDTAGKWNHSVPSQNSPLDTIGFVSSSLTAGRLLFCYGIVNIMFIWFCSNIHVQGTLISKSCPYHVTTGVQGPLMPS